MGEKGKEFYNEYLEEALGLIFDVEENVEQRSSEVTIEQGSNEAAISEEESTVKSDENDELTRVLEKVRKKYDIVWNFENGYAKVKNDNKYNFIDTNGNEVIGGWWYDDVYQFVNGYAAVRKGIKYNFIDTNGTEVSSNWYDMVWNFENGYAKVKKDNKYNFIDTNGNEVSSNWYDEVVTFKNGYAAVRKGSKYNFIDTKGNEISDRWYNAVGGAFVNGYAIVWKDKKANFIDTKGNEISDRWYDVVCDFENGYAKVRSDDKYNYIDTEGNEISDIWFDEVGIFENGYAKVKKDNKYNFINTKGKLMSLKWYSKEPHIEKVNNSFISDEKFEYLCIQKDLQDYKVNPILLGGYICDNGNFKFKTKYEPIKIYGLRFILCLNKRQVILYDKIENTYKTIGHASNIELEDNLIIDKKEEKVYFIYENKIIDITTYYNNHLKGKKIVTARKGIELVDEDTFFSCNREAIEKKLNEERKKIALEKRKVQEDEEQEEQKRKLEEARRKDEEEKQKLEEEIKKRMKILEEDFDSFIALCHKQGVHERFSFPPFTALNQHHKIINPMYFENGRYKYLDYRGISFEETEIAGIDFRECNIEFGSLGINPQTIYGKNLRGCNFEGIHIPQLGVDFAGVDIRGARFSDDGNPMTLDTQHGFKPNPSFEDAIYDENTTYNGVSLVEIFGECKNRPREH